MKPELSGTARACVTGALLAYEPLHAIICWGRLGVLVRMGPFFCGLTGLGWLTSSARQRVILAVLIGIARVAFAAFAYLAEVPGYAARGAAIELLPFWGRVLLVPVGILVHALAYWLIMTVAAAIRRRLQRSPAPSGEPA
jgi:hypothetical protein